MQLTYLEKRTIETIMLGIIKSNPVGINTRQLISIAHANVANIVPNANRHHISGMLAWIVDSTNHHFVIRTPGHSILV